MKKYLIPITTILLASCEQNSHAQNTAASSPPAINTECKNLHKVVDIDDLLYQMYSNIDSHCLFEMPTAELEKIWGIPIFDHSIISLKPENNETQKVNERKLTHKNYIKGQDGSLFLRKVQTSHNPKHIYFMVDITNQYKNKSYFLYELADNLKNGKYPNNLPTPSEYEHIEFRSGYYKWYSNKDKPLLYIHIVHLPQRRNPVIKFFYSHYF